MAAPRHKRLQRPVAPSPHVANSCLSMRAGQGDLSTGARRRRCHLIPPTRQRYRRPAAAHSGHGSECAHEDRNWLADGYDWRRWSSRSTFAALGRSLLRRPMYDQRTTPSVSMTKVAGAARLSPSRLYTPYSAPRRFRCCRGWGTGSRRGRRSTSPRRGRRC